MDAANTDPQRAWAALLPLALLPVASSLAPAPRLAIGAVLLVAMLAWVRTIATARSPRAVALLATASQGGRIGAWELCLLTFVAAVCVAYVVIGSQLSQITYNDGAYYYGVARHMALTGRFEEPIVWHFLHPPDTLIHAPFDYWGCTTSLILAPVLALFGATPTTAFVAMGVISGAALIAFGCLVCCALPLRYRATQLLAVVIFAFSPAMAIYRFQPESISVAQLFIVLALIAFCRRRAIVALLCGFTILLTRGDGLILFALIGLACLIQEWTAGDDRMRRSGLVLLVGLACVGTYTLWSFVSFGTPTPPATRLLPFLPKYWRVYDYLPLEQRKWVPPESRFTYGYVSFQLGLAFKTLRGIPFAPAMNWWLVLAVVPVLDFWRRRSLPHMLIWGMAVAYFVVAWVAGPGFARPRTPYTFTPLFVLAGALGVDVILGWLDAWTQRGTARRIRAIAAGAAVLACCSLLLVQLPVPREPHRSANFPDYMELSKLDDVMQGEPVATNVPWYMIAQTRSPAVAIPHNGEAAIEAVLARYRIRWMVIPTTPRSGGHSRPLLDSLVSGRRSEVGRFRLERVAVPGVKSAVFRVHSAS